MSARPALPATGAAAIAAALLLGACDRRAEVPPPRPRPALTLVVQPTATEASRTFTGTVAPRYQAQLGFQTSGRMTSRDVNVGDRVTQGQRLATLDATVARLATVLSKADLANAEAALVNAEATSGRQQALIKTGSVSQSQVDAAVASRDTARAKVGQAQASLQKAQEQLGYATLTSGYDGVVASWNAEIGQIVTAGQTAVTIARPDAKDAVIDVPDDVVGRFAPGARFTVALLALPSVTAHATAREVSPQADAATRTQRVRLTLEDAGASFRLGTLITTVLTEPRTPTLELPATAILDRDGAASVWVVGEGGRLSRRPVSVAPARDGVVVATAGLAPGERVLTAGVHSVSDGQAVTLLTP